MNTIFGIFSLLLFPNQARIFAKEMINTVQWLLQFFFFIVWIKVSKFQSISLSEKTGLQRFRMQSNLII